MHEDRFTDSAIKKALGRRAPDAASPCPDENMLAAYLEHNLPDPDRSRLEQHVSDCAACREWLALSIRIGADEAVQEGEVQGLPSRKVLFRFSAPLAAVAALVIGIGAAVLSLVTYEMRESERVEVAEQRAPSAAPAGSTVPESPPGPLTARPEPSKPSLHAPAPAQMEKTQLPADEFARAKDKEIRAKDLPAVSEQLRSLESERKVSVAETAALNEADRGTIEGKSEAQATAAAREADVDRLGRVAGGVVGGVVAPARPREESGARDAALQAAALKGDSIGAQSEDYRRATEPAVEKQRASLAAVSKSKAEPGLRDILRRAAAAEKGKKGADSAARVIGGRTFRLYDGFWIDLECLNDPEAELVECRPGTPELEEIQGAVPDLEGLRRTGSPVLISRKGRICIVR